MRKLLDAALLAQAERPLRRASPLDLLAGLPLARAAGRPDASWYRVGAAEAGEVDVLIYDEIGYWGVGAADFVRDLAAIDAATINLRLNSPGGSVFDGIAIYNALAQHAARVVVHIDGWAASIASVIAMSGDEIRIGEAAQVMIHCPWSFVVGSAEDMRKEADVLDSLEAAIVDVYVARTGGDRARIEAWVEAETWFRGQAAVDAGFADAVVPLKLKEPAKPAARLPADFFAALFPNLPADLRAALGAPAAGAPDAGSPPERIRSRQDVRRVLQAHGMSRGAADALATHYRPAQDARDEPAAGRFPTPDPRTEAVRRASQAALIRSAAAQYSR